MTANEPSEAGDATDPTATERTRRVGDAVQRTRADPRLHAIALAGAVAFGLVFAWLHWLGLVLGGALVGLVSPTIPRAIAAGVGFGVLVLLAFALSLGGTVTHVLAMAPAVYVTVASAIALPVFGSLIRIAS